MSEIDLATGVDLALKHLLQLEDTSRSALVLIDGRAGSGKTLFAKKLVDAFFAELQFVPRLISMDDLYPGWEGLDEGSAYLLQRILQPLARGKSANWQVWDWASNQRGRDEPGNGMRSLEPGSPLIVEGCGSLSRESAQHATYRIWIEADPSVRRARYSQRDQGRFDDFYGVWSAQEEKFYQEHRSPELADIRIQN